MLEIDRSSLRKKWLRDTDGRSGVSAEPFRIASHWRGGLGFSSTELAAISRIVKTGAETPKLTDSKPRVETTAEDRIKETK